MRSNAKKVFQKLRSKFESVKREAPKALANEGVRVFMNNFKTESFEGDNWKEVERRIPGTYAYKYPKSRDIGRRTRPILIGKSRRLKNYTNSSIRECNTRRIRWVNSLPYAARQNERRPYMKIGKLFRRRLKDKFEIMYKRIK